MRNEERKARTIQRLMAFNSRLKERRDLDPGDVGGCIDELDLDTG